MQFSWNNPLKALPVLLLLAVYAGAAFGVAGNVQFVIGDAKLITRSGETRALQKGAEINEGDRIITAAGASAQIKMVDGGFIAVRPNTDMGFDTYRYSGKEDGSENAVVSLLQGGFRTITGIIGRTNKQNYLIKTETATIGIRGTDHEPMVILPPAPGQTAIAAPGTYDKVNVGVAFIRTDAGSVDIQRNQVGFAPITKAAPVILPRIPPFYKPTASPGPQKAKDEGKKETASGAAAPAKAGEEQKAAAPAEKAAEPTAQIRSTAVVDPTSSVAAAPAAAPVAAVPAAIAPVVAITATSASGATLNTTTQTETTTSGATTPLSTTVATTSYSSGPALALAYSGYYALDPTLQAAINAQILSIQTTLTAAQTQTAAGSSVATTAQTALSAAQTAATGGKAAYDAALAAGVPATNTLMVQALNAVNSAKQALQFGLNAYDGSGTGTAGSAGVSKILALADQVQQSGSRLVSSAQAWVASNTATTSQDADFSSQSLKYLSGQFAATASPTIANASNAASQAQSAAVSAQSAAQGAATALSLLPITDPHYAGLKAASDAATAAANAAKSAADAALAASTAATAVNQSTQALLSSGNIYFYSALMTYPYNLTMSGNNLTVIKNAAGQVTGATVNSGAASAGLNATQKYEASGGTLMDAGQDAATGLAWGRWQGGQMVTTSSYLGKNAAGTSGIGAIDAATGAFVIGNSYTNTTNLGPSSAHWITGQGAYPDYLAQVLSGTATYTSIGGTRPTDSLGNAGTLNKASLAANFTAQTVDAGVDFSIGGNNWVVQGNGLPLNGGNHFYANSCVGCTTTSGVNVMSTFNKNGSPVQPGTYNSFTGGTTATSVSYTPNAQLGGELLGKGLNSAAFQYGVQDTVVSTKTDSITGQSITTATPNIIQGVVGFSGATQNIAAPYRFVGIEDGYSNSMGSGNSGSYNSAYAPALAGATAVISPMEAPPNRVVDSAAGLTEFIGTVSAYSAAIPNAPVSTTTIPSTTVPVNTAIYNETAATFKVGTAVNKDVGSTTIDGNTISWGRWEGGSVDIYSLDGATKLGTIANVNKSIHWLSSSTLTGPFTGSLPLTGTATYNLVGNTNPTDFKGNVGTLGSATLNADFSKMLMGAAISANFNAATNTSAWSMAASNVPIGKNGGFASDSGQSGVNGVTHTATCTGAACGSQTYGAISGSFLGTAAAGAALSYRMATGASTATTTTAGIPTSFVPSNGVIGVAVFKK